MYFSSVVKASKFLHIRSFIQYPIQFSIVWQFPSNLITSISSPGSKQKERHEEIHWIEKSMRFNEAKMKNDAFEFFFPICLPLCINKCTFISVLFSVSEDTKKLFCHCTHIFRSLCVLIVYFFRWDRFRELKERIKKIFGWTKKNKPCLP